MCCTEMPITLEISGLLQYCFAVWPTRKLSALRIGSLFYQTQGAQVFQQLELKSRFLPNGLQLSMKSPLDLDADFDEQVLQALEEIVAGQHGEELEALAGLAGEVRDQYRSYCLMRSVKSEAESLFVLVAALAMRLSVRLGAEDATIEMDQQSPEDFRLCFHPSHEFLHPFSMLYAVSFLRSLYRNPQFEQRMAQLLEVAQLFFLKEYSLSADEKALSNLRGKYSQETINSFVNLIHPDPALLMNQLNTILLLEDNSDLAEIVGDMLSSFGYVVYCAQDGMYGLKLMEGLAFDLVVSDIQMPGLDGLSFLQVLRNLRPSIPVVITTGFTGLWRKEDVMSRGAVAFLPKPFRMEDLIGTVQQSLMPTECRQGF